MKYTDDSLGASMGRSLKVCVCRGLGGGGGGAGGRGYRGGGLSRGLGCTTWYTTPVAGSIRVPPPSPLDCPVSYTRNSPSTYLM